MERLTKDQLQVAETLIEGRTSRYTCCNGNTTAVITNVGSGYRFHCFRCGEERFTPAGKRSIQIIAQHKKNAKLFTATNYCTLPDDFTTRIPKEYSTWFTSNGLDFEYLSKYTVGWSDMMQRIIIPVYHNNILVSWQARAVHSWQSPKYMTANSANVSHVLYYTGENKQSNHIVLTEDILSALKVGKVTKAASILGTSLSLIRTMTLVNKKLKVIVWLDPDAPGQTAAKKCIKSLQLYGIPVGNIVSIKDPKAHSLDEIRQYIAEVVYK